MSNTCICARLQSLQVKIFWFFSPGKGRWCSFKDKMKCCSIKIICQSCSSGWLQPRFGVMRSYPEQVISRNTWGGGSCMITASPFCWFLQHSAQQWELQSTNKSLPHYAPSVGLFRAPTLAPAPEVYLFFTEIPLGYRLLFWFAEKKKNPPCHII